MSAGGGSVKISQIKKRKMHKWRETHFDVNVEAGGCRLEVITDVGYKGN